MLRHVSIGGIKVAMASRAQLTAKMIEDCRARAAAGHPEPPALIFDANGHAISLAATSAAYRSALNEADIVHADGGSVVVASKWLSGAAISERSPTTDLIHDFAAAASREGLSFYLLGGTEDVNAKCAARLQKLYPELLIAGRRNGYFNPADADELIAGINRVSPDILWLGLGKPLEQIFAAKNAQKMRVGWVITCGGCFDYIAGNYRRAPVWMQRWNLEWLFRALTERRLFWRYLVTSPHAVWLILTRRDTQIYDSARHKGIQ